MEKILPELRGEDGFVGVRTVKKLIALVLLSVIACTMSGCGNKITSGKVVDKKYTPACTETMVLLFGMFNGYTQTTMLMPYTREHPERYTVTIGQANDAGDVITSTHEVTEEVFNKTRIGDFFSIKSEKMLDNI